MFSYRTMLTPTRAVGAKPAHTAYSTQTTPCHRMHACRNLFGFSVFKMFYLFNEKSDWRSVFTIKSLATRSSKLDLISIYFDEFFLLKVAVSITHELPWCLHWSCHDMFQLFSYTFKSKFWPWKYFFVWTMAILSACIMAILVYGAWQV